MVLLWDQGPGNVIWFPGGFELVFPVVRGPNHVDEPLQNAGILRCFLDVIEVATKRHFSHIMFHAFSTIILQLMW